jgi:hypothetical protein
MRWVLSTATATTTAEASAIATAAAVGYYCHGLCTHTHTQSLSHTTLHNFTPALEVPAQVAMCEQFVVRVCACVPCVCVTH